MTPPPGADRGLGLCREVAIVTKKAIATEMLVVEQFANHLSHTGRTVKNVILPIEVSKLSSMMDDWNFIELRARFLINYSSDSTPLQIIVQNARIYQRCFHRSIFSKLTFHVLQSHH